MAGRATPLPFHTLSVTMTPLLRLPPRSLRFSPSFRRNPFPHHREMSLAAAVIEGGPRFSLSRPSVLTSLVSDFALSVLRSSRSGSDRGSDVFCCLFWGSPKKRSGKHFPQLPTFYLLLVMISLYFPRGLSLFSFVPYWSVWDNLSVHLVTASLPYSPSFVLVQAFAPLPPLRSFLIGPLSPFRTPAHLLLGCR